VGQEIIIGMKQDAVFGPVVMFGMGGTIVEVLQDFVLGVAPITERQASEMIRGVKSYPLLEGYRGKPGVDLDLLSDIIRLIGEIGIRFPQIAELDINPLIATEDGFVIVDSLIRLLAAGTGTGSQEQQE
jgi:acyl-CoA synthetase (NDP forming)